MPRELTERPRSPRPQSQHQAEYEQKCPGCGTKVLSKAGAPCPNCGGGMKQGDEMTKKVIDDNDLYK